MQQDKIIERDRYDQRAREWLHSANRTLGPDGAASEPLVIRRPYLVYEDYIRRCAKPGTTALDVCCGTGLYSLVAADGGAALSASDIAEHNLDLARNRAQRRGVPLHTVAADAEQLPFPDRSFDLICCAGSLSYLDLDRFLAEISRLLRPGGWFVCVDSLNHNPIYRLNRYLQYRGGRRSRSTLVRMPTLTTIARLEAMFPSCEASFHGTLSFLAPILRPVLGEKRAAAALDFFDIKFPGLRCWSFKFVFRGREAAP